MTTEPEPVPVSERLDVLENENGEKRLCRVTLFSDGTRRVKVLDPKPTEDSE